MNNRIRDLAKQAGLKQTKWADVETGVEPVRIWQESLNDPGALERFAELLIQECCNAIINEGDEWMRFAENPPHGQENTVTSALFAASRLKEDGVLAILERFGLTHPEIFGVK